MKTKLSDLIEKCINNGAPYNGCKGCQCNERECLINILEEYNNNCRENEVIQLEG